MSSVSLPLIYSHYFSICCSLFQFPATELWPHLKPVVKLFHQGMGNFILQLYRFGIWFVTRTIETAKQLSTRLAVVHEGAVFVMQLTKCDVWPVIFCHVALPVQDLWWPWCLKNFWIRSCNFPIHVTDLGFLMSHFSGCIQTVNSAQSKYSTHQNICNMTDVDELENVCIA
jgi:hypothetical protein